MKSQKKPPPERPRRSQEDIAALREANRVFLREDKRESQVPIVMAYAVLLALLAYMAFR